MQKLTLHAIADSGEALTREQLKLITGGTGSHTGSGGGYQYVICKFVSMNWQCFEENRTWLTAAEACDLHSIDPDLYDIEQAYWSNSCG